MDTLPDSEIKEIWKRIKHYITPSQITGKTREEFSAQLKQLMESAGEKEGRRGSMKTLVKKGFPDRASVIPGIVREAPKFEPIKKPKIKKPVRIPVLPPKIKVTPTGRYSVSTARGARVHLKKNLRITNFKFKGKKAYSVYNTRLKKRVTWGLF